MLKKRLDPALAVACVFGFCAKVALGAVVGAAAGAGAGSAATLGQPLDFSVVVRLGAAQTLTADCIDADVHMGDRRLVPSQLRAWVEPAGEAMVRVHVQTRTAIDEPVVTLAFAAACGSPVFNRYLVLADPPGMTQVAEAVVLAGGALRTVALRRPVAAAKGHVSRRPRAAARDSVQRAVPATSQTQARKRRQAGSLLPRLRLEMAAPLLAEGSPVDQAFQAVAQAASVARQAASAASAAADRIAALERTVEQLRGEAQNNRLQAAQLREQAAQTQSATTTWLLGVSTVALGLLAGWLARRLSAARRVQTADWEGTTPEAGQALASADAAERPMTAAMAFVHSDLDSVPMGAPRTRPSPAWPPPVPPDPWPESQPSGGEAWRPAPAPSFQKGASSWRGPAGPASVALAHPKAAAAAEAPTQATVVLHPAAEDDNGPTRDVSIDELLDLEQQAEFFVVLGQDEAAVELLIEHLRHTGGGSPLPYLKLLEIYRRRGDQSDYERLRARFNHRFNAFAPEWEVELHSGLSLEDYPRVLHRVQQVWPQPLDSMVELESMLFRKSAGELFDLPAYREVLLLYAVARDLLDRESAHSGHVDVLLPLAEGSPFSSTSPLPFMDESRGAMTPKRGLGQHPTTVVDLDLSLDTDRPTSIFDPLQDAPTHPPRIR